MINNKITKNKRVHEFSNDTSRLAFTWLITFADVEGRVEGDPALVKSMLFPRRNDISFEDIEAYIREWIAAEMIIWYEVEDHQYIQFINFAENQVGLRKDKEPKSQIPAPPEFAAPDTPAEAIANNSPEPVEPIKDELEEMKEGFRQSSGNVPSNCRKNPGLSRSRTRNKSIRERETERDAAAAEPSSPLEMAFVQEANIPPPKHPKQDWQVVWIELQAAGAEPEDVREAVRWLQSNDKHPTHPKAIVGSVLTAIRKRKAEKPRPEPVSTRDRYLGGELGRFIQA
jgi:hypothetical protein